MSIESLESNKWIQISSKWIPESNWFCCTCLYIALHIIHSRRIVLFFTLFLCLSLSRFLCSLHGRMYCCCCCCCYCLFRHGIGCARLRQCSCATCVSVCFIYTICYLYCTVYTTILLYISIPFIYYIFVCYSLLFICRHHHRIHPYVCWHCRETMNVVSRQRHRSRLLCTTELLTTSTCHSTIFSHTICVFFFLSFSSFHWFSAYTFYRVYLFVYGKVCSRYTTVPTERTHLLANQFIRPM